MSATTELPFAEAVSRVRAELAAEADVRRRLAAVVERSAAAPSS